MLNVECIKEIQVQSSLSPCISYEFFSRRRVLPLLKAFLLDFEGGNLRYCP